MKRINEFKGVWLNSNIVSVDKSDALSTKCPDYFIDRMVSGEASLSIGLFGICTEGTPDLTTGVPLKEGFTFTSCADAVSTKACIETN